MKNLIAQGAESKLFLDSHKIIKQRFKKTYRINEIDDKLRKFRAKREAKILEKLKAINFSSPILVKSDEKQNLEIEFIDGKILRDVLEKSSHVNLGKEIGEKVAVLHNNGIIHGDLTTSNMIFGKNLISKKDEIFFIDFGLSFFSEKIEDKAVDLHLLKEALESKHSEIWEECYNAALESYGRLAFNSKEILKRLKTVESRGRYKNKISANL